MNLAANARDAMDEEGQLTIRLHHRSGSGLPYGGHTRPRYPSGDLGYRHGLRHSCRQANPNFRAFFTTKEVGRGTGLGLSRSPDSQSRSGGEVSVQSELGQGTTFILYLPRTTKPAEPSDDRTPRSEAISRHRGSVLVVEDNPEVGSFSSQLLNDLGYHTALAASGEEALELLGENPGGFDLVFSDVVMPGMGGVALGKEIRKRLPHLPFVLTSGYSHVLAEDGPQGFELLHKPYSVESLSRVLQRAIVHRARERSSIGNG